MAANQVKECLDEADGLDKTLSPLGDREFYRRLNVLKKMMDDGNKLYMTWTGHTGISFSNQSANMDRLLNMIVVMNHAGYTQLDDFQRLYVMVSQLSGRHTAVEKCAKANLSSLLNFPKYNNDQLSIQCHPLTLSLGRIIEWSPTLGYTMDGLSVLKRKCQVSKMYMLLTSYPLQKNGAGGQTIMTYQKITNIGETPVANPGYINSACHELHRLITGTVCLSQNTSMVIGNCGMIVFTKQLGYIIKPLKPFS